MAAVNIFIEWLDGKENELFIPTRNLPPSMKKSGWHGRYLPTRGFIILYAIRSERATATTTTTRTAIDCFLSLMIKKIKAIRITISQFLGSVMIGNILSNIPFDRVLLKNRKIDLST